MTQPSDRALERERQKLYITDAELYRWLGVPENYARALVERLEKTPLLPEFPQGLPRKQELFYDRRYRRAVMAYLDKLNGVDSGVGAAAGSSRTPRTLQGEVPPRRC